MSAPGHFTRHFPHLSARVSPIPATVVVLALLAVLALSGPVFAQEAATEAPAQTEGSTEAAPAEQPLDAEIDTMRRRLDAIETAIAEESVTEVTLIRLRAEALQIRARAIEIAQGLQPEAEARRARLAELGPPPEEGAPPESETAAATRAELTSQVESVDNQVNRARVVDVQANQIIGSISEKRRARFTERLSERSYSVLSLELWSRALTILPRVVRALIDAVSTGIDFFIKQASLSDILALGAGILVAVAVNVRFFRSIRKLTSTKLPSEGAPIGWKATIGLLRIAAASILPAFSLFLLLGLAESLGTVSDRMYRLGQALIICVAFILVFSSLSSAYLAPRFPKWRIVPLPDFHAASMRFLIIVLATVIAITFLLTRIAAFTFAPLSFEIAIVGLAALIVAALLSMIVRLVTNALRVREADGKDTMSGGREWLILRMIAWIAIIAVGGGVITGYVALAQFIIQQFFGAVVIYGLARLLIWTVDYWIIASTKPGGDINRFARSELGFAESTIHQLGVLLDGLLRLSIIIVALMLMLMPWGFEVSGWADSVNSVFRGFRIGDVTIAPASIVSAIVVFIAVWTLFRAIRQWFENTYLPTTNLDIGIQNSLATAVGYVGTFLAAGLAVSVAGFDLGNFAIIAGALSVGIGFGLQSIVSNFVSGLILLAERPIKAGDWIVVGAEQGTVRRISVRSTEIETFDRASVIVPNSDLITGQVKNWTHSSTLGRIIVNIGVSYDSDPQQVREILLHCARDHPDVLTFPEPAVYFLEFGASSLDFALYAFLADVGGTLRVRSDLRFEIVRRFREAGIEIPFPQQDINFRNALTIADRDSDVMNAIEADTGRPGDATST